MADDKTDKPTKGAPSRRPTTIDLKATEIRDAARPDVNSESRPESKPESKPETGKPDSSNPELARAEAAGADTTRRQAATAEEMQDNRASAAAQAPNNPPPNPSHTPWGLIAAGVVGAILFLIVGIGAGHWLSRDMARPAPSAPVAATPAVSPELLDRLAKLEGALNAPRGPDPQLLARIAAAEASVKTAADIAAARDRRNDETAAIAREARERASSAANTADDAAQKARAASTDQSRAELEAVVAKLAAIETVTRANQAELAKLANASVNDDRSRLAIAALSLRHAVDSGLPFAAELAALRALSADPKTIAALEPFAQSGVPTAAGLGRELSAAMPAIWKAATVNEPVEGSFLDRLQANAGKIVRVRPVGEAAGEDAASVKARLELRASQGDIRGALAELSKLPPEARAPAAAWIKTAEARDAALAAAQSLAQSALAALAKPAS